MKLDSTANYLLCNAHKYEKEPVVKNRHIVQEMDSVFRKEGWPVTVSSGGANWLFYGNTQGRRFRLKNKLYLEASQDCCGRPVWYKIGTYTIKDSATPAGLAKIIARRLGSLPIESPKTV